MNPTKSRFRSAFALLAAAGLLLAACTNQMEPAKQAIDNAESAVSAAAVDAGKYMPDQLAALQGRLTDLKASFDKKDYATVVASAPGILADAKSLADAAATKKSETLKSMAAEWGDLSASVPTVLKLVTTRVDALARNRHAAKGLDLAAAKSALADATDTWSKAEAANNAGNVDDAVGAAKDAQSKLQAAAAAVKLTLPAAPAAP